MDMRVILFNNNPPFSGVGRYAYSLYENLAKLGLRVSFISWDKELFDSTYKTLRPLGLSWPYYLLKFKYLSAKLNTNASLIHVTNAGYLASIIPRMKKKCESIVVTIHDTIPMDLRDGLSHKIAGRALKYALLADYCICISRYVEKNLPEILGTTPRKSKVIYYGVDHELFKPRSKIQARRKLNLPDNKFIILNVGSEEPRKNIPVLFETFSKITKRMPNTILVRVGEKGRKADKLINSLKLRDKVLYRRASDKEVALYYNASDLLIHPAYYEDFGMPPLEAMASGLPVIASNQCAIPEIVGDAGMLLNPFDVEGFTYWIQEILENRDLRIEFSKKGYKRSLDFSWEKCARETLEVYREVLNEI
jgi:glycosyltransferase involved in cell wall biosynthesis